MNGIAYTRRRMTFCFWLILVGAFTAGGMLCAALARFSMGQTGAGFLNLAAFAVNVILAAIAGSELRSWIEHVTLGLTWYEQERRKKEEAAAE